MVYLLSSVGGLITNIDLDRVHPEFQHFLKFYYHYIKLTACESEITFYLIYEFFKLHIKYLIINFVG